MPDTNWRDNPHIMAAREFAKKFHAKQVIILHIDDGNLRMASYGETGALCKDAGKLGDIAHSAVMKELYERAGGEHE